MTNQQKKSKAIHITLWVTQALLAAMFLMAGSMKSTTPIDELVKMGMTWAEGNSALVRFIGISEVLGGIGLILPALLRIKPILTPLAALGLFIIMALAVGVHLYQNDAAHVGMPV